MADTLGKDIEEAGPRPWEEEGFLRTKGQLVHLDPGLNERFRDAPEHIGELAGLAVVDDEDPLHDTWERPNIG